MENHAAGQIEKNQPALSMLDISRKFFDKTTTTPYHPSELFCNVCTNGNWSGEQIKTRELYSFCVKKNGAACLDPWEIFVLLALKMPFHFISLRKLENYLQFYMTIAFKLNRTKKKVHHKFEIAFNFKKEIPLKCFLSPLGILYPLGG